jgi:hypothetical protein
VDKAAFALPGHSGCAEERQERCFLPGGGYASSVMGIQRGGAKQTA